MRCRFLFTNGLVQPWAESRGSASTSTQIADNAEMAISPEAIVRSIDHAIEQPENMDTGEIVIRPAAQA